MSDLYSHPFCTLFLYGRYVSRSGLSPKRNPAPSIKQIHGKWKPIILWQLGKGTLNVIVTMQEIGIELMKEDGKEDFLKNKGFL